MQVSSRFASKLLVTSAVSEYFEDMKVALKEAAELEYEAAMYDMAEDDGYDPRDYDDVYYGRDDDYDYDPYYDEYYDSRDDYYFMDDYYYMSPTLVREPLIPVERQIPDAGESLGDILSRALANA